MMARQGYAKLSNNLWLNDKVLDLIDESPRAYAMWTLAISYCSDQLNDGVMSRREWRRLGATEQDLLLLVAHGLVDKPDDGSYRIHDYLRHQNSREEVEKERNSARERMSRRRAEKRSEQSSDEVRANTDRTTTEHSDEVRNVFLGLNQNQNQNQIPSPTPPAEGRVTDDGGRSVAERAWIAYPRHSGSKPQALDEFVKIIDSGEVDADTLLACVETYAKKIASGSVDARWVPNMSNWLSRGQWRDSRPQRIGPGVPSETWITRRLLDKLPDTADAWTARRQLIQAIRDGTPPEEAAKRIIQQNQEKGT